MENILKSYEREKVVLFFLFFFFKPNLFLGPIPRKSGNFILG